MAATARHRAFDLRGEALHVLRFERSGLRGDDHLRAGGQTGHAGEVAALAAHRFQHHDAAVAARGVDEVIHGPNERVHGRIDAERHVGELQIVVDRGGDADDAQIALVSEQLGAGEGAVTADDDERAHVQAFEQADDIRAHFRVMKFEAARGAEDGAALAHDAADAGVIHLNEIELVIDEAGAAGMAGDGVFQADERLGIAIHSAGGADEAAVAVAHAEDGDFFAIQAQAHDGAEESVHAGGVAAAKKDGDGVFGVIGGHGWLGKGALALAWRFGRASNACAVPARWTIHPARFRAQSAPFCRHHAVSAARRHALRLWRAGAEAQQRSRRRRVAHDVCGECDRRSAVFAAVAARRAAGGSGTAMAARRDRRVPVRRPALAIHRARKRRCERRGAGFWPQSHPGGLFDALPRRRAGGRETLDRRFAQRFGHHVPESQRRRQTAAEPHDHVCGRRHRRGRFRDF